MSFLFRLPSDNRFFYGLLIILSIWHVWSLPFSPLPWFDETFFASMTHSLINGNGFVVEVNDLMDRDKQVYLYGPVYFLLTGASVELFGMDIIPFRIVNFLFGGLTLWVFYQLMRQLKVSMLLSRALTLLILFDVLFVQNAHSGRMEMVTLFFALSAFLFYFKSKDVSSDLNAAMMALAGILAFLTTPRIIVLIFPLFGVAVVQRMMSKKWKEVGLLLTIPVAIYLVWLFSSYGSIDAFLDYYIKTKSGSDELQTRRGFQGYLGGMFYVPFYQYPLIITGFLSAIWLIVRRKFLNPVLLFLLCIVTFYILVKDTGGYSVLIIFGWYCFIALAAQDVLNSQEGGTKVKKWATGVAIAVVLLVNGGIFALKATVIVGSYDERNPKTINSWVEQKLPEGSKIVGDDRYYYACLRTGSDFRYIDRPKSNEFRAERHATVFNPDFLMFSDQTENDVIAAYEKYFEFEEEWIYQPTKDKGFIAELVSKLPIAVQSGYSGRLIKVSPRSDANLKPE